MTTNDLILAGGGKRLTIGIRNNFLVFGISDRHGNVWSIDVPMNSAKRVADWCSSVPYERVSASTMLRACSAALTAYEEGLFVQMNSSMMYERGFSVDTDDCSLHQGEDWIAIFEPQTMELEVYSIHEQRGMDQAARVNVGTGHVVIL